MSDAAAKLPLPRLVDLTLDPHKHERVSLPHLHTWVAYHAGAVSSLVPKPASAGSH